MKVTIDVSMYPNRKDFIPPIDGFIEKLIVIKTLKSSRIQQVQSFKVNTTMQ